MERTPTNDRHKLFSQEYLSNGLNATQAYLTVYGEMDYESAKANASRLLTHDNVKRHLAVMKGEIAAENEINKEELILSLKKILYDNLGKSPQHSLKAIEILSKMGGLNAAEKQEITHKMEQPLFLDENKDDKEFLNPYNDDEGDEDF